jgi:hypothetical protein
MDTVAKHSDGLDMYDAHELQDDLRVETNFSKSHKKTLTERLVSEHAD